MSNEKSAKEVYYKAVMSNIAKVEQIKAKLEKDKKESKNYILMIALLETYSKVLNKLQESLKKEVSYMEENFIHKLASTLKQNKSIVQSLNQSIDLMTNYNKQINNILEYKRNMFNSYFSYEQTSLVDEAICRVVQTYSDDCLKKNNDIVKITYTTKEYEYTSAVTRFNEEAPAILQENVLPAQAEK